jgi:D-galactarolactone cycloisomerase
MDIFMKRIAEDSAHVLEAAFALSFSSAAACRVSGWGECFGPAELNAAVVGAFRERQGGADALASERVGMRPHGQFRDQGQRDLIRTALNGVSVALREIPERGGLAAGVYRGALRRFAKHRVLPAQ